MSTMALVERGEPAGARSKHINIRFFWIKDRVDSGEVSVEHTPTEATVVQGKQFLEERQMLTNWD